MTVEAGAGGAVTPALPVVGVGVELKVDHLSGQLGESDGVGIHGARKVASRMRSGGSYCWGWNKEE